MAGSLQIRNVPEEMRRVLKARAAARGKSLNAYLLELLAKETGCATSGEVLERAARRPERVQASSLGALASARTEREERWRQQPDA